MSIQGLYYWFSWHWDKRLSSSLRKDHDSLWRIVGWPLVGHDRECSKVNNEPKTHWSVRFFGCQPYRRHRVSQKENLSRWNPWCSTGRMVMHLVLLPVLWLAFAVLLSCNWIDLPCFLSLNYLARFWFQWWLLLRCIMKINLLFEDECCKWFSDLLGCIIFVSQRDRVDQP